MRGRVYRGLRAATVEHHVYSTLIRRLEGFRNNVNPGDRNVEDRRCAGLRSQFAAFLRPPRNADPTGLKNSALAVSTGSRKKT